MLKSDSKVASMLPPVARYAYNPGRVSRGTAKNRGGTQPHDVAKYAIFARTGGVINHGIANCGFNTIGIP